jgi:type 1 fimbria pilin
MRCELWRFPYIRLGAAVVLFAQTLWIAPASFAAENNVYMHGALVAEPCVIPPGDGEIALDFGTIVDKYLYSHTRTAGLAFSVHLAECDLSLSQTVRLTFQGVENAELPGLLAVDAGSGAKGIAIGLETPDGKPVALNKPGEKFMLQAGSNVIPLMAYVQGEPGALANRGIERGVFSATATFSLEYE